MNNGDWVRLREGDDAVGMIIGWRGPDAVVSWDVPEEQAVTTERLSDLIETKGLYKSRRRGYATRVGQEEPGGRQGVNDGSSTRSEARDAEGASILR